MLAFKNMLAVRPAQIVAMRSFSVMSALQKELPPILTEEQAELPKEIVSGAPPQMSESRVVRIWKESKAATQSGKHNTRNWKLDWDLLGKGNRWENDMMGYQGSADYMQGTIMAFDTKEGAIRFAKGQGWDYYVQEPRQRKFKKKEYAINFLHSTGPLKHIRTK